VARQFTKKDDGTFAGSPSIREISVQFFIDLGIDILKLFFAREWKSKQNEKISIKESRKRLRGIIGAAITYGGKINPALPIFKKANPQVVMTSKKLISQALDLHKANPHRSPSEYLKELQRLKE